MPPKDGRLTPLLLIAAADQERRRELGEVLSDVGYRVELAGELAAAVETLQAKRPDLVLADARLPEGPIETCRRLRAVTEKAEFPILLLVGREHLGLLAEARTAGASDFVETTHFAALAPHRVATALRAAGPALAGLGRAPERDWAQATAERAARSDVAFQRQVVEELTRSIAQADGTDKNVAVLAVEVDLRDGSPQCSRNGGGAHDADREPDTVELAAALAAAVREFEQRDLGGAESRIQVRMLEEKGRRAVVLVPELTAVHDAARLGGRIRAALSSSAAAECGRSKIGVGISTYPDDAAGAEELLELAHKAAELARLDGEGGARYYAPAAQRRSVARFELERRLAEAIEGEELTLYYQPKMELRARQIVGMEALVRWEHPELGTIRPAEFIPLAEESGLIVPLGDWVLRAACRQAKLWQDLGMQPIRMAVNLSQAQFRRPDLCEHVTRVLGETGLAPQWLELELTESMLMHDVQATLHGLHKLKAAGIHLAIDDFGTGYSSLSYLRRFPIDTLKIDQSFVRELMSDPDDAAIVTSIILMGHSLKLSVVAEGVETESQLSFLEVLQCDEIQGYLLSPPVPQEEAEGFLYGGRR